MRLKALYRALCRAYKACVGLMQCRSLRAYVGLIEPLCRPMAYVGLKGFYEALRRLGRLMKALDIGPFKRMERVFRGL